MLEKNLTSHAFSVTQTRRSALKQQRPAVIWFTGLSGAGKSTAANALELALADAGRHTYLLDGDNVRMGLCRDLGFSDRDREENIRRVAEVANLFVDAGIITITAFISPFIRDREVARQAIGEESFIEVFIDTPLAECERRDPKGLYSKARQGIIKNFTGLDSAYEPPLNPHVTINTLDETLADSTERLMAFLRARNLI